MLDETHTEIEMKGTKGKKVMKEDDFYQVNKHK